MKVTMGEMRIECKENSLKQQVGENCKEKADYRHTASHVGQNGQGEAVHRRQRGCPVILSKHM